MSKQILNTWLKTVGFSKGDPFGSWEADREEDLPLYFEEYPYFDEIMGTASAPRTAFLFADRGCGKSANRKMIEYYCREGKTDGPILSVLYTDFSWFLERASGDLSRITARMHVDEILRRALPALFEFLRAQPHLVDKVYDRDLLRWYFEHYSDYLTARGIKRVLREGGISTRSLSSDKLRELMQKGALSSLAQETGGKTVAVLQLLDGILVGELLEMSPEEVPYTQLLEDFAELVQSVGIETVYILVDRVDEFQETVADPQAGVRLLEPLISNLHLMELPGVAFKFFLPTEMADDIMRRPTVRTDRLIFRKVEWQDADLSRVLQRRLETFSEGQFSSLQAIAPEVQGIDEKLVKYAAGSPRNLLRLGEFIFSEHCRLPTEGRELISQDDFNRASRKLWAEQGIRIDKDSGRVFRAGEEVDVSSFSPLEYDLLLFLYDRGGQVCSKYEIIEGVYEVDQAGVEDAAVDQLVHRLREKIEPEPSDPVYLITLKGHGYRLEHTAT